MVGTIASSVDITSRRRGVREACQAGCHRPLGRRLTQSLLRLLRQGFFTLSEHLTQQPIGLLDEV